MSNNNPNISPIYIYLSWFLVFIFSSIIVIGLLFSFYVFLFKEQEVMDVVRVFAVFLTIVLLLLSIVPARIISLNRKIWHYQKENNADGVYYYYKKLEFFVFIVVLLCVLFVMICIYAWINDAGNR